MPDKQEIDRKMVVLPEMPVRTACEQEECIEEEIFVRSLPELPELPELCKAQKGIHKDDIQLEITEVNTTEICKLPREIKLEIPIEQGKSKLHTEWKEVLTSKVVTKANPTKLVKREICRPSPKPPYILNTNGEVIGIIENVVPNNRPPL